MQVSTRGRYAVLAMAELATRPSAAPVTIGEIAASQQLSQCYLEQLFGGLRRAGLVVSARGVGGGYRLARPPEQLTIAAIVAAVDENLQLAAEPNRTGCRAQDLWLELGRQIHMFLGGITLADVVQGRVCGRAAAPGEAGRPEPLHA